jgi:hypothetical protein
MEYFMEMMKVDMEVMDDNLETMEVHMQIKEDGL